MKKGTFIVLEGIDGSGKSTQANLLRDYLKNKGFRVEKIDFPQYGTKSAGLVEEYLNGKYGSSGEVGPYKASIFYACDRYDAGFIIRRWLADGKIVLSDRYVASNVGHQGGKILSSGTEREWKKYIQWIYNFEYGLFGIPKPDITVILKSSPEYSLRLAHKISDKEKAKKRKSYLGNKTRDIHERDRKHLLYSIKSYVKVAKMYPRDFKIVECIERGKLLSPRVIHDKIVDAIKRII